MSDCCLILNYQFLGILWREQVLVRWWCPHCTTPIFIVLAHCNNTVWVDMSLHSATLSQFQANQSGFTPQHWCLAEKQQIPIFLVFNLTWPGIEPRSKTLKRITLTITPQIWLITHCDFNKDLSLIKAWWSKCWIMSKNIEYLFNYFPNLEKQLN